MNISVDFIFQLILQILIQEQQGDVFDPDYFNNLLILNTFKYFDDNYKQKLGRAGKEGGYEVDQQIMDSLSFLKTTQYMQIDSNGVGILNDDYLHYSSLTHHMMVQATLYDSLGIPSIEMVKTHISVDVLTDGEVSLRRSDANKYPTEDFPICTNKGAYFQFYPENLQYVEHVYLRNPKVSKWVGTWDDVNDMYIYDPINSVQIEFPDIDKYRFVSYLLATLGFSY